MVFKVVGPRNFRPDKSLSASLAHDGIMQQRPALTPTNLDDQNESPSGTSLVDEETDSEIVDLALSEGHYERDPPSFDMVIMDLPSSPGQSFSFSAPLSLPINPISEHLYYGHFITTVSRFLIIYDTPSNSNPFRMLPRLPGASEGLRDTMTALGALHLSSLPEIQDKHRHIHTAMEIYSKVVSRLRAVNNTNQPGPNLSDFATSLLLCVFEMMSATDNSWRIHLAGACQAFKAMYSPQAGLLASSHGRQNDTENSVELPMRRFLISLMSYLDVAASCATGEGTVIDGDYWESFAGSWEYNLGAPSFNPSHEPADRVLAQLRHAWSKLMSIQVSISSFAKLQRSGWSDSRRAVQYDALANRIWNWHNATPSVFSRLAKLDKMPPNATRRDVEIFTATACVESYARACTIHLNRVMTQKLGNASDDPEVALAVKKVLDLTLNFSSGIHRLALLWPMFMAGAATRDDTQQALVRDYFQGIKSFGFKVCWSSF